ncbi:MAG: hypothetical protein WBC40_01870 [Halobacteriota archaeon]
MSSNYIELHDQIEEIEGKRNKCAEKIEEITLEERRKYEKPQYRMWSGDVKDLEGFTNRLEEWLNQPSVAEAKRYLLDLKKWSESPEEISLEEIEKDWKFLSDNLDDIKDLYKQVEDIGYENIKKKTSSWILARTIEKDIERAMNWATNANKFATSLRQFEDKKVGSNLAEKVKKDAIKELLVVISSDRDNTELISQNQELIDKSETINKNKPEEINEKAVLKTYSTENKGREIEETLSIISEIIGGIKGYLINLEWVEEFTDFKDYTTVWKTKQNALKENDLRSIHSSLEKTLKKANYWKESKKKGINEALLRTERMANNVEKEDLKNTYILLREQVEVINWNKPDLESLFEIISGIDDLREKLRKELIERLQNEDATSIIEEPEIIEDLGRKQGWDFDRFFKALEVVLRNGIIGIKAMEEK